MKGPIKWKQGVNLVPSQYLHFNLLLFIFMSSVHLSVHTSTHPPTYSSPIIYSPGVPHPYIIHIYTTLSSSTHPSIHIYRSFNYSSIQVSSMIIYLSPIYHSHMYYPSISSLLSIQPSIIYSHIYPHSFIHQPLSSIHSHIPHSFTYASTLTQPHMHILNLSIEYGLSTSGYSPGVI